MFAQNVSLITNLTDQINCTLTSTASSPSYIQNLNVCDSTKIIIMLVAFLLSELMAFVPERFIQSNGILHFIYNVLKIVITQIFNYYHQPEPQIVPPPTPTEEEEENSIEK